MSEGDWLADRFEENRTRLQAVAYRMLGSFTEADDAVQEAWLRLSRSDTTEIGNLNGWLTTVVARVSLDMLRSRKSRREDLMSERLPDDIASGAPEIDPEREALLADAVGPALLVILETLAPAERLAFVLHDMFAVPFDEIAPIVGRSPIAARQLASRARRRVHGIEPTSDVEVGRQRVVVDAFLAASRNGEFDALLALLDPDAEVLADSAAMTMGAGGEVRGARAVAEMFSGRARAAQPAMVGGIPGAAWIYQGRPRVAFAFTVVNGKVRTIELIADPERLASLL